MASVKSNGACDKCDKEANNTTMIRHLAACHGPGDGLHVSFDVGPGTWWLHLALHPAATLSDIDDFLRDHWLECCGHLSAFRVGDIAYRSHAGEFGRHFDEKLRSMEVNAASVLKPKTVFSHEYDFGSTTELRGRVHGRIASGTETVTLLAENSPIEWPCAGCSDTAEEICPCCFTLLCGSCDAVCECGESDDEDRLPVVNSPRMGVCGYGGG